MSLEQAISDHASALRELAAAIRASADRPFIDTTAETAVATTHATAEAVADKAISDAKASTATKQQAEVVKKPTTEVKAAAATTDVPVPTYDDVKAKVLALSKEKGRDPTVQLLERHGVAKAPDLKPEQYADFIKDVDAILAGTYSPEAAEV